jgi:hypothetical protein
MRHAHSNDDDDDDDDYDDGKDMAIPQNRTVHVYQPSCLPFLPPAPNKKRSNLK